MVMDDSAPLHKYVHINPRTATVELTLPPHLEGYAQELKEKIAERFSFLSMDHLLERRIQDYVKEF